MEIYQPFRKAGIGAGMEGNTLKDKIAYILFYTGVIIEVLLVLIDKSAFINPIEGQIFRLTFVLFFAKVCLTKYSVKEYLLIAFFLVIGTVSYFVTGRNEILRIVMFIAACKGTDMIKCLKLVFWMTLWGCILIIFFSLAGVYGTLFLTQDYGRGSVETRYVLGMGHPNALQCMVCVLTMLGMYLYHRKWKWYNYILTLGANFCFFLLTHSKTGFLVSVGAVILFFIAAKIRSRGMRGIFAFGNIAIFAGSIIISVMAAKDAMCLWHYYWEGEVNPQIKFYVFLDNLLTGRIHSLVETDHHEGIMSTWRLFSGPGADYYFDMGWVRLFYWYGVMPAFLAIIVLTAFLVYFARQKKYDEVVFVSMLALYTIVEAHIVSVYIGRNYLLFLVGMYWWRLEKTKEDIEKRVEWVKKR